MIDNLTDCDKYCRKGYRKERERDTVEGDNELHFRGTDPADPVRQGGMGVFNR